MNVNKTSHFWKRCQFVKEKLEVHKIQFDTKIWTLWKIHNMKLGCQIRRFITWYTKLNIDPQYGDTQYFLKIKFFTGKVHQFEKGCIMCRRSFIVEKVHSDILFCILWSFCVKNLKLGKFQNLVEIIQLQWALSEKERAEISWQCSRAGSFWQSNLWIMNLSYEWPCLLTSTLVWHSHFDLLLLMNSVSLMPIDLAWPQFKPNSLYLHMCEVHFKMWSFDVFEGTQRHTFLHFMKLLC